MNVLYHKRYKLVLMKYGACNFLFYFISLIYSMKCKNTSKFLRKREESNAVHCIQTSCCSRVDKTICTEINSEIS